MALQALDNNDQEKCSQLRKLNLDPLVKALIGLREKDPVVEGAGQDSSSFSSTSSQAKTDE